MSYTHVQLMLGKELEKLCNVFGFKNHSLSRFQNLQQLFFKLQDD